MWIILLCLFFNYRKLFQFKFDEKWLDKPSCIDYVLTLYIHGTILMGKHKKEKSDKDKDKEVKLVVRIEAGLRDAFIETCQDMDTTASREVRRFIRDFLKLSGKET